MALKPPKPAFTANQNGTPEQWVDERVWQRLSTERNRGLPVLKKASIKPPKKKKKKNKNKKKKKQKKKKITHTKHHTQKKKSEQFLRLLLLGEDIDPMKTDSFGGMK